MVGTPPLTPHPQLYDRPPLMRAAAVAAILAGGPLLMRSTINPRTQALAGVVCFTAIIAASSSNLRAVSWRTVGWGIGLQVGLALLILKLEIGGVRPGYLFF